MRTDSSAIEFALGDTGNSHSIQHQAQVTTGHGGPVAGGGGSLFTEPVLVVNQQAKMFELANEYKVYNQHGQQLGSVAQVGQSGAQKALRMMTKVDSLMTTQLEIRDIAGQALLRMTRPATLWKSTVHIQRADGTPIGEIRQENAFGRVRFSFEVGGQRIGSLNAQNLRAWDFVLNDAQDQPIGKIKKTFEGIAKAMFTTADNYVVQLYRPLQDPLISMVLSSALTIDVVLKQVEH